MSWDTPIATPPTGVDEVASWLAGTVSAASSAGVSPVIVVSDAVREISTATRGAT